MPAHILGLIVVYVLVATTINAERIREQYLCTPDECVRSDSIAQVGIKISSKTTLNLLPGTYTSSSPAALLLQQNPVGFLSEFATPIEPYPGSNFYVSLNSSSNTASDDGGIGWPIVVTGPSRPATFGSTGYTSSPGLLDVGNISTSTSTSAEPNTGDWESLYLPPGVYLSYPSYPNVIFRGSVPLRQGLGRGVRGLDLNIMQGSFGSDACNPSCGPGGACLPSPISVSLDSTNSSNTNSSSTPLAQQTPFLTSFTCSCLPGFTGSECMDCLPGHYGPECKACPAQCDGGRCDDGPAGNGGCLGVMGNSTQACGCLRGTCTSGSTCDCSAGWTDGPGGRCNVCAEGFFLTGGEEGDCQACPLGALTCRSETRAITCSTGYSIDAATGTCRPSGGQASCSEGRFWDGSSCTSCSPACNTCTGPGSDQCLECASPRFNLNGTCVGYDGSNGICDSSSTRLKGVYVANNVKGRCEACPSGCLACAIPSFSILSVWNDTVCTACQEGWVLQNGKCQQECTAGFFLPKGAPNINGTCEACDMSKCASCHLSATQCSSCIKTGEYATATGECVSTCPSGSIKDDRLGRCVSCPSDCATCSDNGTCLSCSITAPILSKGRCSAFCPVASYWEASTSTCSRCADNCTSCTGPETDQCVSCGKGMIMKDGTCTATSCTLVDGLGMCLRSDLSKETLWWPYVLVIALLAVIGLVVFWWIRRSRRLRREDTAAFAATLDDNEIHRRARGIGGIFKMLNIMRMNELRPGRESFHSDGLDRPPPAYNDKSGQPVFSITPPSPTAQGPLRASAIRERHDDDYQGAFESMREHPKQVSFADESNDATPWPVDKKDTLPEEKARGQHCMV